MKTFPALLCLISLASTSTLQSPKVSYDGYKVVRLPVGNDLSKVAGIVEELQLETWTSPYKVGSFADIVVSPDKIDAFNTEIAGLDAITMHEDLGASIAEEANFGAYYANTIISAVNSTWFNSYHAYADHLEWLKDLQASFPANSEVVTSGSSLQGNAITGIHIYGSAGKGVNPAIVFHGTVHAREWIATMVTEYFAYNLLTNYASNTETKGFVDKYDFYIFPVVNPDGFIYTQTTDRMWRKNRQPTSGSTCLGHDINRNWPYQWDGTDGASTEPCSEVFRGLAAGDAPETQALSAKLLSIKATQGLKLYIDYHSYSQLLMTPYGYSCTAVPANHAELQSLAAGAAAAILATHGETFQYGPICSTIYKSTGSSIDYVYETVGGQYVFGVELRDAGNYGFLLPVDQILPSGEEAYAGVRYLLQNMK